MKIKNIATTLLLMASAIHHGSANENNTHLQSIVPAIMTQQVAALNLTSLQEIKN